MIIIDKQLQELQKQGKPIRVGLLGAGFMARGIAIQILNYTPGMQLAGIAARHSERAHAIIVEAGAQDRNVLITDDYHDLLKDPTIDVIVECTGSMEYATRAMLAAFAAGKHVVSMNAEVDATIGHALRDKAIEAGVIYTVSDGDQPGVEMNLYRYVQGLGLRPVLCGNIKGLQDPYRNPTTQAGFAAKWGQNPYMVTSFADGTKISFEQACVANATGMRVGKRGMHGPTVEFGTPVEKSVDLFSHEELLSGPGIVDYVVGAVPNGGVFVLGTQDDPIQKHYLNYYKVGEGPLYCFFAPYHLCHFETPASIARVALHGDVTIAPTGERASVEVITVAKKDLRAGESLDAFGGYTMYGECENSDVARQDNLLPIGLAEGVKLKTDLAKDAYVTFDDVEIDETSLVYSLWKTQNAS